MAPETTKQYLGVTRPLLVVLGALAVLLGLAAYTFSGIGRTGTEGARLRFEQREQDLGQISYSPRIEHRFVFTNSGDRPLRISDIRLEPASPLDASMPDCA